MIIKLYKIWTKIDKGAWTFDVLESKDIDQYVIPFRKFIAKHPGYISYYTEKIKNNFHFVFVFDTIENAKLAYQKLNDFSIPEVKNVFEMHDRYAEELGIKYEMSWKLIQVEE